MIDVQHSIASPAAVLKVIKHQYPSIGARECELLELGCNDNYQVKGKRRDYVFRLYRFNWWPVKDIDEELRLLEVMHRNKLNVCKPVRAKNKQRYIKINAPEGFRFGALFNFIPGQHLGFNLDQGNQNFVQLGNRVAEMHSIADNMKQPVQRWTMTFDNVVNAFLNNAVVVLGHREKDLKYLRKLARQLEEVLLGQPEGAFNFGFCHGDLHVHNVMLQPNGELALFDFDLSCYSWRAYDLATIWWALTRNKRPAMQWRTFLRGYTQQRKLTKQEKQYLPWFVILRQFEFLNFQLSMRKHIGTGWLNDTYYDFHIQFFKDWVKEHINS